jgi:hypothetical protein
MYIIESLPTLKCMQQLPLAAYSGSMVTRRQRGPKNRSVGAVWYVVPALEEEAWIVM